MAKISPYIRIATKVLSRQNKFKTIDVGTKKVKIFDPADMWEVMLKAHKKIQRMEK